MSMPQVYLTESSIAGSRSDLASSSMQVYSSRWKAIAEFTRFHPTANFEKLDDVTTVSVDGTTVGWITKKMVQ